MRATIRKSFASTIAAVLVAFAAVLAAGTAQAQCVAGVNGGGCTVFLTVYNASGATYTQMVTGSGSLAPYNMPPGFNPIGVVDANGMLRPFVPVPVVGCVQCIPLRTPAPMPPCCASVCYDPGPCVFHIFPCPPPC